MHGYPLLNNTTHSKRSLNLFFLSCFTIPGHGRCVCGVCMCLPAFRGRACECPLSLESCLSQDEQICAGRGDCHCGTCVCHDNRFQGPTCELCPSCPSVCTTHRYYDPSSSGKLSEDSNWVWRFLVFMGYLMIKRYKRTLSTFIALLSKYCSSS